MRHERYSVRHAAVDILIGILLALILLACNLIYCAQRIMADLHHSRSAEVAWGLVAFCGGLMAAVSIVWVTAASLAHL